MQLRSKDTWDAEQFFRDCRHRRRDGGCGSGGTLRKGLIGWLTRRLKPAGLLQFKCLPGRSLQDAAPPLASLGSGFYALVGRDFEFDTTVLYSLGKQNRWELTGQLLRDMNTTGCLDGLQVFLIEEAFTNFANRLVSPPPRCQCNLAWAQEAQRILRHRNAILGLPGIGVGSVRSQRNLRRRQKHRGMLETVEQRTVTSLVDALGDFYANYSTNQLPVRYSQTANQLVNLRDLLGLPATESEATISTPVEHLLEEALSTPPKLVVHCVETQETAPGNRPVWRQSPRHTPLVASDVAAESPASSRTHSRRIRRLARKQRRSTARQEASDGLLDWLSDDYPVVNTRSPVPAVNLVSSAEFSGFVGSGSCAVTEGFVDFSLDTSRATSASQSIRGIKDEGINDRGVAENGVSEDATEEGEEDELRPVLSVRRDLMLTCGGQPSDSWPVKFWLRPPASMAKCLWPGPALVIEELPAGAMSRRGLARVRCHLLGCRTSRSRLQFICRLLACDDPFGSLPQLLSELAATTEPPKSADSTNPDDATESGVRISEMTFPPLYSWLYQSRRDSGNYGFAKTGLARDDNRIGTDRTKTGQRLLPPLKLQPTPSAAAPQMSSSAHRRRQDRVMSCAACGTCGVSCPRPALCPQPDWLTALTACGHWHCHACWTGHVTRCVTMDRSGAVVCPSPGCRVQADPVTTLWFMPHSLYYKSLRQAAWQPLL